jgi:hypothetical protein
MLMALSTGLEETVGDITGEKMDSSELRQEEII